MNEKAVIKIAGLGTITFSGNDFERQWRTTTPLQTWVTRSTTTAQQPRITSTVDGKEEKIMKKTYEAPCLLVEKFDVTDVLTASSADGTVDTVGNQYQTPDFTL